MTSGRPSATEAFRPAHHRHQRLGPGIAIDLDQAIGRRSLSPSGDTKQFGLGENDRQVEQRRRVDRFKEALVFDCIENRTIRRIAFDYERRAEQILDTPSVQAAPGVNEAPEQAWVKLDGQECARRDEERPDIENQIEKDVPDQSHWCVTVP